MAFPWLQVLDAVIGVTDLARSRKIRKMSQESGEPPQQLEAGGRAGLGGLEARLAGVVVAALKEAFERDTHRLELEREQLEAERLRAERALALELRRQASDREIGRLRLLAGVAVASWIGTLFFSAPQASTYNFANRDATHSIHVCVKMLSGLQVYGRDARIRVKPPTTWTQGPNQRAVLFGTDRNMTPGTISDVLFDDITFDFNHEFGAVHSYTYAFNAIGVDKLQRRNLKILSSGNRVGRGLWTENCRYRKDINIHHQNITQGGYLRYDDDQTWHNLSFDTFTEAIDIDSMCNRVSGSEIGRASCRERV